MAAVVLLQVAAAAHDAQHSLAEVSEACSVCLQLDTRGDAVDTAAGPVESLVALAEPCTHAPAAAVFRAVAQPEARAPPLA